MLIHLIQIQINRQAGGARDDLLDDALDAAGSAAPVAPVGAPGTVTPALDEFGGAPVLADGGGGGDDEGDELETEAAARPARDTDCNKAASLRDASKFAASYAPVKL